MQQRELNNEYGSLSPASTHQHPSFHQQPEGSEEQEKQDHSSSTTEGSTVMGAAVNLTNCIVGAGCIGFGGAMAQTGGLLSIIMMLFFAILAKVSFDMVVESAVTAAAHSQEQQNHSTYEDLGSAAFGRKGRAAVMIAKGVYSFGSLIAYQVIVKNNFAPAVRHLLRFSGSSVWTDILLDDYYSTVLLCCLGMFPLCLFRDITPLEGASVIKIGSLFVIISVVVHLFFTTATEQSLMAAGVDNSPSLFVEHWLTIRPGFIQSMGTFLFTFVAQHCVHLVFQSLKPELRNVESWRRVSTAGVIVSTLLCFPIGLFVYMTFWEQAGSDLFLLYAPSTAVDTARIALCVMMLLTYPMSFFSCRELIILSFQSPTKDTELQSENNQLLLPHYQKQQQTHPWWLLPGEERRLIPVYHELLTAALFAVTLLLALAAPSLGDVLNLVGCVAGTAIGCLLPAVFSYKLQGYSHTAAFLFVVGVVVGSTGTYMSLVQLARDLVQ